MTNTKIRIIRVLAGTGIAASLALSGAALTAAPADAATKGSITWVEADRLKNEAKSCLTKAEARKIVKGSGKLWPSGEGFYWLEWNGTKGSGIKRVLIDLSQRGCAGYVNVEAGRGKVTRTEGKRLKSAERKQNCLTAAEARDIAGGRGYHTTNDGRGYQSLSWMEQGNDSHHHGAKIWFKHGCAMRVANWF